MSSYTKLFSSIIHSSVWQAPAHVKILWVTLLAMKDRDGIVEASVPGLAAAAGISMDETKHALAMFCGPDPYSRTKTDEGRRLREVPGGWFVINHDLYNERSSADDYKAKNAARQARLRAARQARKAEQECSVTSNDVTLPVTPRHAPSRSVTPSTPDPTLLCSSEDQTPRAPSAPSVVESLRFPDPNAVNFNRRDLERMVSDVRGSAWRVGSAPWEVKSADETAALIMSEAGKQKCDPTGLARRAFIGWLDSQKSVDVYAWLKNWNAAVLPPAKKQEPWRDLEG